MRRRLATIIVVAGVILGGMVSMSFPFGAGLVIVRRPIVLLQDAAERVVRALFRPRSTSAPGRVSASDPAVVSVAADAGPARPIMEPPAGAPRLTQVRRGTRRAEHDSHEAPDRVRSQTEPEGDASGLERSGALRIAGRDQSDTDVAAQEPAAIPNPNGPQAPPNGQQAGGAAPPPGNTSTNDGPADAKSPSVSHGGSNSPGSDSPGRNEPGHGGEHGGGDHRVGDHGDGDKGDRGHK